MANEVSVLNISGTNYTIKDAAARANIENLRTRARNFDVAIGSIQSVLTNQSAHTVTWEEGALAISTGSDTEDDNNTIYRITDFIAVNTIKKIVPNVGYKFQIFCYTDDNGTKVYQGSWDGAQAVTSGTAIMYQPNSDYPAFNVNNFNSNYTHIKLIARHQDNSAIDPADFMPLFIIMADTEAVTAAQVEEIVSSLNLADSTTISRLEGTIENHYNTFTGLNRDVTNSLSQTNEAISTISTKFGPNVNNDLQWESGIFSPETGTKINDSDSICLPTFFSADGLVQIVPNNDLKYVLSIYSSNTESSFVGMLDTTTNQIILTTIAAEEIPWTNQTYFVPQKLLKANSTVISNYYIRISVSNNTAGGTISSNDGANIEIYQANAVDISALYDDVNELVRANLDSRVSDLEDAVSNLDIDLPEGIETYATTIEEIQSDIAALQLYKNDTVVPKLDQLETDIAALQTTPTVDGSFLVYKTQVALRKPQYEAFLYVTGVSADDTSFQQLQASLKTIIPYININAIIGGGNYFRNAAVDINTFEDGQEFINKISQSINSFTHFDIPFLPSIGMLDNNSNNISLGYHLNTNVMYGLLHKHMERYGDIKYIPVDFDGTSHMTTSYPDEQFSFYYDLEKTHTRFLFIDPHISTYTHIINFLKQMTGEYHIILIAPEMFNTSVNHLTALSTHGDILRTLIDAFNDRTSETVQTVSMDFRSLSGNNAYIVLCLTNGTVDDEKQYATMTNVPIFGARGATYITPPQFYIIVANYGVGRGFQILPLAGNRIVVQYSPRINAETDSEAFAPRA